MNKFIIAFAFILAAFSGPASAAQRLCYIYIAGSCSAHPELKANTWFTEDYNGSGSNGAICVHRAREYREYCQMPPDKNAYVNAAFVIDGEIAIAKQFRGGGDPETTFSTGWSPVVP